MHLDLHHFGANKALICTTLVQILVQMALGFALFRYPKPSLQGVTLGHFEGVGLDGFEGVGCLKSRGFTCQGSGGVFERV